MQRLSITLLLTILSIISYAGPTVKVACVGNSITYGARIVNRAKNSYPQQLQNILGEGYEVKNFGVSGRTLLKSGDKPYWNTKQYKNSLEYNPDILFIKLGTNDSKLQNRIKLDQFESDYKELIESYREQNSNIRVILLLPLPSFVTDTSKIWNPIIKNRIVPLTQKVAYDTGVEVLDMYHMFIDQSGLIPDKIHPSSLGATLIAKRAYEAIKIKEVSFNIMDKFSDVEMNRSSFYGFKRSDFEYKGLQLKVVEPKKSVDGMPWIWRARFFGHEPQADIALLERGFHIVYCEVGALFGSDKAVDKWNQCYSIMREAGLNSKVALEGMSRGGLIIYNWAYQNLDKVACIYADAPVLDIRSWPGGFGEGKGSPSDWKLAKEQYNILSDESSIKFKDLPIYRAKKIAKSGIPLLHICGDADNVVPIKENTQLFEEKILKYKGNIETIYKDGVGHHPHSLENPSTIVDFILRATGHKINFAAMTIPGSEYRSAAGWRDGKGWWYQAEQIDSLCTSSNNIDLLLIGNSITQGWGGDRSWVSYRPGEAAADKEFKDINWIGAGISGDRTEHIAWRLEKGDYARCNPNFVTLAIGVNNFGSGTASEITEGIKRDLKITLETFPEAKIILFGPLPTGLDPESNQRAKYREIHRELSKIKMPKRVHYRDIEKAMTNRDMTLNREFYGGDGIHLIPQGYEVWAKLIKEEMSSKW